jgi:hypothetical protein
LLDICVCLCVAPVCARTRTGQAQTGCLQNFILEYQINTCDESFRRLDLEQKAWFLTHLFDLKVLFK